MKPNSKTKPLYWLNFGYVIELIELYNICKFQGKLMKNTEFPSKRLSHAKKSVNPSKRLSHAKKSVNLVRRLIRKLNHYIG